MQTALAASGHTLGHAVKSPPPPLRQSTRPVRASRATSLAIPGVAVGTKKKTRPPTTASSGGCPGAFPDGDALLDQAVEPVRASSAATRSPARPAT